MGNYNRLLPGGDLEFASQRLRAVEADEFLPATGLDSSDEELAFYHTAGAEILRQAIDLSDG